ncbi:unnamed protein product [Dovyalis caffra]|uniref:Uncharacterized protein n=1 Tax=Dovyalis caffra TaxID=77055 RepID=A0AAV1RJ27_9ROSI|nr:unnamed protein product [Dovyalis caffra]
MRAAHRHACRPPQHVRAPPAVVRERARGRVHAPRKGDASRPALGPASSAKVAVRAAPQGARRADCVGPRASPQALAQIGKHRSRPASPSQLGQQSDERVQGSPLGPSARTDKGKAPAVAPSQVELADSGVGAGAQPVTVGVQDRRSSRGAGLQCRHGLSDSEPPVVATGAKDGSLVG